MQRHMLLFSVSVFMPSVMRWSHDVGRVTLEPSRRESVIEGAGGATAQGVTSVVSLAPAVATDFRNGEDAYSPRRSFVK